MASETGPKPSRTQDDLLAEDVAQYLRDHPDFLSRNPDLLRHLMAPQLDRGATVVDLQYHLLEKLRGQLTGMHDQQRELIATTRANLNNQNRVHAAVLFLLDAKSFEHLIQTITTDLAVLLDLDVACLVMEQCTTSLVHQRAVGVQVAEGGAVTRWLGKKDVLLQSDIRGLPEIYGGAAGLVRSEALVRLRISGEAPLGLLALGSREPDTFHPGQATELLCFLTRVIERCIRSWLDLPP
jgi:uncharacterized protein YigA (DUF484 family)